jgi:hypothetical protein
LIRSSYAAYRPATHRKTFSTSRSGSPPFTKADLNYAMAKARAANTAACRVRLHCIQAISDANDQANGAGLKNAGGIDMVKPDPAFVAAIEDVAELVDNLSPQGKLFISCAGAAQMFKVNTLALINRIDVLRSGTSKARAITQSTFDELRDGLGLFSLEQNLTKLNR